MLHYPDDATLVPENDKTLVLETQNNTMVELLSELGTMVVNSDTDATMKSTNAYIPLYTVLFYFTSVYFRT